MNIFVLHKDPVKAAKLLGNRHVVKMTLESVQILSSCHSQDKVVYKRTHYNHPCSIWTRSSSKNYEWLFNHAFELCREYTRRYGKVHKCEGVLRSLPKFKNNNDLLTSFAQAMPEEYKDKDAVKAYRNYYLNEKLRICKWNSEKDIPAFIKDFIKNNHLNIEDFLRK